MKSYNTFAKFYDELTDNVEYEKRSKYIYDFFKENCANCKDSWNISLIEFQLGNIYAKGIGVKKNHKIAEKYYRSSASKGNPYAKKKFVAGKYVK